MRKFEDATEEYCKIQNKKYKEAISAKCKIGDTEFEVENESNCKAGTWDPTPVCSAKEITDEKKCTGIPTFKTGAKCELIGYWEISLKENDRQNELK